MFLILGTDSVWRIEMMTIIIGCWREEYRSWQTGFGNDREFDRNRQRDKLLLSSNSFIPTLMGEGDDHENDSPRDQFFTVGLAGGVARSAEREIQNPLYATRLPNQQHISKTQPTLDFNYKIEYDTLEWQIQ